MLRSSEKPLSRWARKIYPLALVLVVLVSVRLYCAWFTPFFSSDNAVHVLMAQHFSFPEDFYYWGQDRRGSFEPALVFLLLKGFASLGIAASPLFLLSVVQYSLIVIAFFCLSHFLRNRLSKFIFSLLWFLPPMWFQDMLLLAHPYYAQCAFLGLGLRGIHTLEIEAASTSKVKETSSVRSLGLITLVVVSLFCALWISELSAFVLIGLCGHLGFLYFSSKQDSADLNEKQPTYFLRNIRDGKNWTNFVAIAFLTATCASFLAYMKRNASLKIIGYSTDLFANGDGIAANITRIAERLWPIVTFQSSNFFLSFSLLGLILFLLFSIMKFAWQTEPRSNWLRALSSWKTFFLGCSCFLFIFLIFSNWVYLNATVSRYFTLPFMLGSLALLMELEDSPRAYAKRASYFLLALAFSSALSLPTHLGSLDAATPIRETLEDFRDLENSSFIGDYWASYVICSVAPDVLSCTPHDKSAVRCRDCVEDVLSEDRSQIYLVQNAWLDDFPAEAFQFNRRLVLSGPPREIGGYVFAPYSIDVLVDDAGTP